MNNVTARPIHFTSQTARVVSRLNALGLKSISGHDGETWQVFAAPAGGRIGVHEVAAGSELDGVSRLGFEVPDGEALEAVAASFIENPGNTARPTGKLPQGGRPPLLRTLAEMVETPHGTALKIKTVEGLKFLVDTTDSPYVDAPREPGVEVAQMWFTNNTPAAREVLLKLGATELVTKGLGWDDCRLPGGGRTQLHASSGNPRVSIGCMSAQPLEQLKHQVDLAGDDASIVDEAWGRYLDLAPVTVTQPQTGLDGELTWVNEEKQDFYGYQVHQLPTDSIALGVLEVLPNSTRLKLRTCG